MKIEQDRFLVECSHGLLKLNYLSPKQQKANTHFVTVIIVNTNSKSPYLLRISLLFLPDLIFYT